MYQGTCIKDPWTKKMGGRIESGRWGGGGVSRAGESDAERMGTTVIEKP